VSILTQIMLKFRLFSILLIDSRFFPDFIHIRQFDLVKSQWSVSAAEQLYAKRTSKIILSPNYNIGIL